MGGVGVAGAVLLLAHRVYTSDQLTWVVVGGAVLALCLALAGHDLRLLRMAWVEKTTLVKAQTDEHIAAARLLALTKGMGGASSGDPFAALLAGMNGSNVVDQPQQKTITWDDPDHLGGKGE